MESMVFNRSLFPTTIKIKNNMKTIKTYTRFINENDEMRKLLDTIIMPDVKDIKIPNVKDIKIPNVKDIKVNDMPNTKEVLVEEPKEEPQTKVDYLESIYKELIILSKKYSNVRKEVESIMKYLSRIFNALSSDISGVRYKDEKIYQVIINNLDTIVFKFYFKDIPAKNTIEAIRAQLSKKKIKR